MPRCATASRTAGNVGASLRAAALPVPADSSLSKSGLAGFAPEGILQSRWREGAVGFSFRARIIRNFLVLQARRRGVRVFLAIGWRHGRTIFWLHGRPPLSVSFDLFPLKH